MAISIGIGVLVLIIAAIVFLATRPGSFRYPAECGGRRAADVVFAIINDLHQWGQWSPYDKRDPNMKKNSPDRPRGRGPATRGTEITR